MMSVLTAEYFTDPLCSWSWSNEPHYRKLKEEFGEQIDLHHRMGGLMEKWSEGFYDPLYDLKGGDAKALAEHQEEVSLINRMPIDVGFWFEHPPRSTHPASVAVKAAWFQGREIEDIYLRRVREGFLTERRRLDEKEELIRLAEEVPGMDIERFKRDIDSREAVEAFRSDFEAARNPVPEAQDKKVTEGRLRYSFPTLILENSAGEYRVLDGDNTYEEYLKAIRELAPDIRRFSPPDIETFVYKYRSVATKEVSVVCEVPWDDAEVELERMVDKGMLKKRLAGHFYMWKV